MPPPTPGPPSAGAPGATQGSRSEASTSTPTQRGCPVMVRGGPETEWQIRTEFGRFSTRLHPYLRDACKANEDTAVRTVTPATPPPPPRVPPSPIPPAAPSATPPRGLVAFSIPGHCCPQGGPQLGCDEARTCPRKDASTGYPHARHQPRHNANAGCHSRHSGDSGHPTWHPSNPSTCGERG